MKKSIVFFLIVSIALLNICLSTGCNKGPALCPVNCVITLDGSPLEGANVSFTPVQQGQGDPAVGVSDAQGKFKLTMMNPAARADGGTTAGDYKVTVRKAHVEWDGVSYVPGLGNSEPAKATTVTEMMPQKYTLDGLTPLQAKVVKGKNEFTFDINSQ